MRRTGAIIAREVRSQIVSPVAWSVAAGFLFLAGYFFFDLVARFAALSADYRVRAQVLGDPSLIDSLSAPRIVVGGLYRNILVLLLFVVPTLAMRVFADERRQGTLELLLTSPAGAGRIVIGKYLGILAVALPTVGLSALFVLLLGPHADLEPGPVWTGWLGLLLATAVLCAMGIAVATVSDGHVVTFVGTFVCGLLLFAADWPAERAGRTAGTILRELSLPRRLDGWSSGVVTFADLVYFASWVVLALVVAGTALASERGR